MIAYCRTDLRKLDRSITTVQEALADGWKKADLVEFIKPL